MGRSRKPKLRVSAEPVEARIESLAHDGRGVCHVEGKTVFVDGALPDETVRLRYVRAHRNFDEARTEEVLSASPLRVEPRCPHFGICGGCALQHLDEAAQIEAKQNVLLENFRRLGNVEPEQVLPPLTGPVWGYRRKARLGVKYVIKKEKVLVGFREKHSPYVAELSRCEVLHPLVGERLTELADLIAGLEAYNKIAQIEVAVDETHAALILRNLKPLSKRDQDALIDYGRSNDLYLYLQPGGPDTVTPLYPEQPVLSYRLADHDVTLQFEPNDFTQVNLDINADMVNRALELLAPEPDSRVLDLFCGLGNFTLPLARRAAEIVGVEGDASLVQRARDNAERNGIGNAKFYACNLAEPLEGQPWAREQFSHVLLDPPRSGALEIVSQLPKLGARRIVYVSCHPATLARDAGVLVNEHGYRLKAAGVMDMFPHTAHVESIAVFERG